MTIHGKGLAAGPAVKVELDRLPTTPIAGLTEALPRNLFPDRIAKSVRSGPSPAGIAHRMQEKAYGDALPASTRRLLDQLVKAAMVKPTGRLQLPRRIKPGSELVRTWIAKPTASWCWPTVLPADGKTFANLSEIATEITGDKMERTAVFGLRRLPAGRVPMAGDLKHLRCAIYTRKSTDMGWNWSSTRWMPSGRPARPTSRARRRRDGNASPAQRRPTVPGNLDRPALKKRRWPTSRPAGPTWLSIHKIDRLTRSLADFTKTGRGL